jgi:sugar phosphate isomerase/epimerase
MTYINRRGFLHTTAISGFAAVGVTHFASRTWAASPKRKFTMDLVCGAIGVRASQRDAIQLAHKHGFESVGPSAHYLAGLSDDQLDELLGELKKARLVWGSAGLPVDFRRDEQRFRDGISQLPKLAKALQRAGVTRVNTWLRPSHDTLTYLANFKLHVQRLREVAKVLGDHGLRFGMEYVGPKTSWTSSRHAFIHTMAETKELISEIGQDNVGFVLDSWHWYTAHETEQDLLTLTNSDVVACDLNDAPAGIPIDEQMDGSRELPAATGVIDLTAFLGALIKIGYDGPVRAEPFNKKLRDMDNEPAVAATAAAMKKAFGLAS